MYRCFLRRSEISNVLDQSKHTVSRVPSSEPEPFDCIDLSLWDRYGRLLCRSVASKLESPKSTVSQSSLDLMSGDNHRSQIVQGQVPMGEPKMRKELKEYQQIMQTTVEGALKRFSGDLQRVLEDISRYVTPTQV